MRAPLCKVDAAFGACPHVRTMGFVRRGLDSKAIHRSIGARSNTLKSTSGLTFCAACEGSVWVSSVFMEAHLVSFCEGHIVPGGLTYLLVRRMSFQRLIQRSGNLSAEL